MRIFKLTLASTTGHCEGSKIFCVLHNVLVAFMTNAKKSMVLQAKDEFHWNKNFEM